MKKLKEEKVYENKQESKQKISAEELCIEAELQFEKVVDDKKENERRYKVAKIEHDNRIEKILTLLKDNPTKFFNGKLLVEKLPCKDEDEKRFFENFSKDSLFFGGYGVRQYYSFFFFKNDKEEIFFRYNPPKG